MKVTTRKRHLPAYTTLAQHEKIVRDMESKGWEFFSTTYLYYKKKDALRKAILEFNKYDFDTH